MMSGTRLAAPTAQQTEREDEEEGVQESNIFPEFARPNSTISEYSDPPGGNDERSKRRCSNSLPARG